MASTRLWSRLLRKPAPSGHGAPAEYEVSELFQAPAQLGFPGGGPPSRLPLGARRDRRDSHVDGGLGRPRGRRAISPGQTQLVGGHRPARTSALGPQQALCPGIDRPYQPRESAGG